MHNRYKLQISDLDENGRPILTQCRRCKQLITRSKINQHAKQCGKKIK